MFFSWTNTTLKRNPLYMPVRLAHFFSLMRLTPPHVLPVAYWGVKAAAALSPLHGNTSSYQGGQVPQRLLHLCLRPPPPYRPPTTLPTSTARHHHHHPRNDADEEYKERGWLLVADHTAVTGAARFHKCRFGSCPLHLRSPILSWWLHFCQEPVPLLAETN